MKTLSKALFFLFLIVAMMACEETIETNNQSSDLLMGTWVNPTQVDTLWQYDRAATLDNTGYGFSFKEDDQFVERKNAGWGGTPPVTYSNFEGTWTQNESLINITVGYWGGKADYQWKVISVDDHHLTVYKVKEVYGFNE